MQLLDKLLEIENKVIELVEKLNLLKDEKKRLELKNLEYENILRDQNQKLKNINDKLTANHIATSLPRDEKKNLDIKKKIDDFAKELDKCIGLLSK